MDELNFRRQFLSDPNTQDPEMLAYRHAHDAQWCDDILAMEAELSEALDVPVPHDLCERLKRLSATEAQDTRVSKSAHWGWAASVTFLLGLGGGYWMQDGVKNALPTDLANMAITHTLNEQGHTNFATENVTLQQINDKLGAFKVQMTRWPSDLAPTFVNYCSFGKHKMALHMTVATENGKRLNVYFVPEYQAGSETLTTGDQQATVEGFENLSVIVVGSEDDNTDQATKDIRRHLIQTI